MNILAYISGYDGCGYYRVQLPAKFLNKLEDVHFKIATQYSNQDIAWSDIVVLQKQTNSKALPFVQYAKSVGKKVIVEVDDDYFNIPSCNPAYKYYVGKEKDLINFYSMSDAITVTTHHLAKELSKYNPNTYAIPNSLDIAMLDNFKNMSEYDLNKHTQYLGIDQKNISLEEAKSMMENKVVLGWGGSPTHYKDVEQVTEALLKLTSENKNIIVVMVGCATDTLLNKLRYDQLMLVKPVPIFNYSQLLSSMKWDIGICPIEDNLFNRSKSNLKFLEFAINGFSCVCSNVENYAKTVTHGFDGLLADNTTSSWYSNLKKLIEDVDFRKTIAKNGEVTVRTKFSMSENYKKWEEVYKDILKK